VRRVLDGRRAVGGDVEAQALRELGLAPVRGLLLHGPPGCGKTMLARELAGALGTRAPKVVAAPELLDRWVGGSERLVRELFGDAERDLAARGNAAALHVVVVDEIDAVFRRRSYAADAGEVSRSSAVNQLLAKLDGINAMPNVLVIGMTNRKELLDEALLRPGRLEVQIFVGKPNMEGRRDILDIHTKALRQSGRLSDPLCRAIDGKGGRKNAHDIKGDTEVVETSRSSIRKRDLIKRAVFSALDRFPQTVKPVGKSDLGYYSKIDLAADKYTGNFSGADLAGLIRCAGSIALARARVDGNGVAGLLITLEDMLQALEEVRR